MSITAEGHTSTGSCPKVLVPSALVYDARGNGEGGTIPTMTGDHQNRITDYTAVVVEPIILDNAKQHSSVSEGVAPSLLKQMGEGVNNVPIVVETPPRHTQ